VLSQYDYAYDLSGQQVQKADHTGKTTAYTYDGLGRLTGENQTASGAVTKSYTYTYDDCNNRASLTAAGGQAYTTAYSYDNNNRLRTETKTSADGVDTMTSCYDPNGNQISSVPEHVGDSTGEESVSLSEGVAGAELSRYNGFNQMVETVKGDITVTYAYAPSGLRTDKIVSGVTTSFVWDGDQLVLEQTGTTMKKYIRGLNLAACVDGQTVTYYLFNAHGDVVQLTDASGAVTRSYEYDAFGVEENPSAADSNPFRYCGEYLDLSSGTYYLRARYYNPAIGRFLSEDTNTGKATDPLSLNFYTYCKNNPIKYVDPTGHYELELLNQLLELQENWTPQNSKTTKEKADKVRDELSNSPCYIEDWGIDSDTNIQGLITDIINGKNVSNGTSAELTRKAITATNNYWIDYDNNRSMTEFIEPFAALTIGIRGGTGNFGGSSNSYPTADEYPKPPNWNDKWEYRYPESLSSKDASPRWFDPEGGEWRYHYPDNYHDTPHWDYNPWTSWNSSWQNLYP
jgi:RHS repeat-associated protein